MAGHVKDGVENRLDNNKPIGSKLKPLYKAEQGVPGKKHLLSTYHMDIKTSRHN
jgi:hypothetical protein